MLAGVRRTAPLLDAFLDEELARHGLDDRRLALLGFSQGTMLSLHVGPRRARPTGRHPRLLRCAARRRGAGGRGAHRPPVMLVHGDADDVVPVEALFHAVEGLQAAEIPVHWIIRPGLPHSIDPEGIAAGGRFLASMLPG